VVSVAKIDQIEGKLMEALLIIDMQIGSFNLSKRFDEAGVVQRINGISNHFRKNTA
jgi:hypothetical protein